MSKKIFIFIATLFSLTSIVDIVSWRLLLSYNVVDSVGLKVIMQLLILIRSFIPAALVLFFEKHNFRKIADEYKVTLKGIDVKSFFKNVLCIALVYPLFILFLIYVGGHLCGIEDFGKLRTLMFQSLIINETLRYILSVLVFVGIAICTGLTISMLVAIGGEVAWRGFLENNIALPRNAKTILIGLVWGVWTALPTIIRVQHDVVNHLLLAGMSILFCVVCSFYFLKILQRTRTLFATAAVQGIIVSFSTILLVENTNSQVWVVGNYGLLSIISIILVTVIFGGIKK